MEKAALILAILALVVAIMALPFFSKPKWRVYYDSAKGYKLWCWIRNIPISKKFLIWIGYERRTQLINSAITIEDENGAIIWLDYGVASSSDIRRGIVEIKSKNDGRVFLKDKDDKFSDMIKIGLYTLELELWGDRKILKERKRFRVNATYPFVGWIVGKEQK